MTPDEIRDSIDDQNQPFERAEEAPPPDEPAAPEGEGGCEAPISVSGSVARFQSSEEKELIMSNADNNQAVREILRAISRAEEQRLQRSRRFLVGERRVG
ncbi:hypothetical protein WOA01_20365 [Methylocystis sp. IM2]|uniref:hypothetical protein n=1 Tax=Methylocystis sp. IM2 TaxID=3136563 RepID=UPI0030FB8433